MAGAFTKKREIKIELEGRINEFKCGLLERKLEPSIAQNEADSIQSRFEEYQSYCDVLFRQYQIWGEVQQEANLRWEFEKLDAQVTAVTTSVAHYLENSVVEQAGNINATSMAAEQRLRDLVQQQSELSELCSKAEATHLEVDEKLRQLGHGVNTY